MHPRPRDRHFDREHERGEVRVCIALPRGELRGWRLACRRTRDEHRRFGRIRRDIVEARPGRCGRYEQQQDDDRPDRKAAKRRNETRSPGAVSQHAPAKQRGRNQRNRTDGGDRRHRERRRHEPT
jgi:hypothetical protein